MTKIADIKFLSPNLKSNNSKSKNISFTGEKSLERTPLLDVFNNSNLTKEDKIKIISMIGIALASGAAIAAAIFRRKTPSAALSRMNAQQATIDSQAERIKEITDKLSQSTSSLNDKELVIQNQATALNSANGQLLELKGALNELVQIPENAENLTNRYHSSYSKIIDDTTSLSYDPLYPYEVKKYVSVIPSYCNTYKLSDIIPFETKPSFISAINTDDLKSEFLNNHKLNLEISPNSDFIPVKSPDAFIKDKKIDGLGLAIDTDFKLDYGRRINWSNQKLARDMMQNFYDGHGNTLDGVKLSISTTPSGSAKVRIEGKGLYDYESIKFVGSGTKETNPYNAGGFGEGAKIVVANLLGKHDTDKVTFRCADWKMDFTSKDNIMQRTLYKTDDCLNGNYLEFETQNRGLVDAIIDSVNYFRHSSNPDFANLTYDSEQFAFRIKEKGKGNLYLTQRFEYNENGTWDGAIDNLDLIFKRKPDAELYQEVVGKELPKDRDRLYLTNNDIEDMTKYFAVTSMSDDDIIKAIVSTKPLWGTEALPEKEKRTPLNSFLSGLLSAARMKQLAIDIGDERLAHHEYCNQIVTDSLSKYDYKFLPSSFSDVYFPSVNEQFTRLSKHKPLSPDEIEIKKLRVLDEAVDVVANSFQDALLDLTKNISLTPKVKEGFKQYTLLLILGELDGKSLSKEYEVVSKFLNSTGDLEPKELDELVSIICKKVEEKFKTLSTEGDANKLGAFVRKMVKYDMASILETKSANNLNTLYDFTLVSKADAHKPKYIFDRNSEIASYTLGESIVKDGKYFGHWVDKEYLDKSSFSELLATWIHEICHKTGGDGTPEFTYALTDLVKVLLFANKKSALSSVKLSALEKVFDDISR